MRYGWALREAMAEDRGPGPFGAAGMVAGNSNLVSKVGTNDIPGWPSAHIGGECWQRLETYEKHAPIYHVGNVSTPI